MQVPGQDAPHIRAIEHLGKTRLVAQFDENRQVEHARQRRVVHGQQGAVGRAHREFLGEPVELRRRDLPEVVPGHARVERDHAQPADVVHAVDGPGRADLAQQPRPERGALVVVAHDPDHLGPEPVGGRLDDRAKPVVRLRLALVGEVARKHDGLRTPVRCFDLVEQVAEVPLAVYPAVESRVAGEQVSVAEVEQKVVRPWILGRSSGHGAKSITST